MQFGLQSPIFSPADGLSGPESFALLADFCQTALESGFDCVSLGNHLIEGPEVSLFQPIPAAAALMARFPSLYVMTSSFCFPYYGSVAVAQEVATLEAVSPGGFLFGVGQGYVQKEADAAGIDQKSRARRLAESIAVCRLLWSDPHASFQGEFCQFEDADIGVRPANGHGPPILIAADRPRTIARIPEIGGDYWLSSPRHGTPFLREAIEVYKRAVEHAGGHYKGIVVQRDISLGRSKAEAEDGIRSSYERTMQHQHGRGQPQPGLQNNRPFDDLKEERLLMGTSSEVAEQIVALNDLAGAGYIHLRVQTIGGSLQRSFDAVHQLGEEVLPAVRDAIGNHNLFPDRRTCRTVPS